MWMLYLWIVLATATAGLWVASLALGKLLSASEPKPSLSEEWR